jgi:hypothetical protein
VSLARSGEVSHVVGYPRDATSGTVNDVPSFFEGNCQLNGWPWLLAGRAAQIAAGLTISKKQNPREKHHEAS